MCRADRWGRAHCAACAASGQGKSGNKARDKARDQDRRWKVRLGLLLPGAGVHGRMGAWAVMHQQAASAAVWGAACGMSPWPSPPGAEPGDDRLCAGHQQARAARAPAEARCGGRAARRQLASASRAHPTPVACHHLSPDRGAPPQTSLLLPLAARAEGINTPLGTPRCLSPRSMRRVQSEMAFQDAGDHGDLHTTRSWQQGLPSQAGEALPSSDGEPEPLRAQVGPCREHTTIAWFPCSGLRPSHPPSPPSSPEETSLSLIYIHVRISERLIEAQRAHLVLRVVKC